MKVYNANLDRLIDSKDQLLTDAIWKAKEKKNPWEVIDLILKAFKETKPRRYQSYVIHLKNLKESEKRTNVGNSTFRGVSKDKENDAYLAHTVDFPVWLMMAIRKVYGPQELQMDKEFFREFGKRYREFQIMEKV